MLLVDLHPIPLLGVEDRLRERFLGDGQRLADARPAQGGDAAVAVVVAGIECRCGGGEESGLRSGWGGFYGGQAGREEGGGC